MVLRTLLIPLLALATLASGCGKSHKRRANEVTLFIHGDPVLLIKDNEKLPSFLTPANALSYNNFHLAGVVSLVEREPQAAPTTYEQVEKDNSTAAPPGTIEDEFVVPQYSFVKESETRYIYAPNSGNGYRLYFEVKEGALVLSGYNSFAVTAQHYSVKTDDKAFSVLMSYEVPSYGKVVTAFYFASSATTNPIVKASKDFAFLFDTVKVGWDEPIELQACGTFDALTQQSIDASVASWFADTTPSSPTRPVKYTTRTSYAPFSDLNQHCIFLISGFKLENSVDFYTAGVTLPTINYETKHIVDSDVMIFMDHARVANPFKQGLESPTLMHELGHFYGLGHEFKKTPEGEALHPSIMGYSTGRDVVTPWDFEALRDLYGQSLSAAP